eukprot:363913-Chlamydomonas_euryale.AAC.10
MDGCLLGKAFPGLCKQQSDQGMLENAKHRRTRPKTRGLRSASLLRGRACRSQHANDWWKGQGLDLECVRNAVHIWQRQQMSVQVLLLGGVSGRHHARTCHAKVLHAALFATMAHGTAQSESE